MGEQNGRQASGVAANAVERMQPGNTVRKCVLASTTGAVCQNVQAEAAKTAGNTALPHKAVTWQSKNEGIRQRVLSRNLIPELYQEIISQGRMAASILNRTVWRGPSATVLYRQNVYKCVENPPNLIDNKSQPECKCNKDKGVVRPTTNGPGYA